MLILAFWSFNSCQKSEDLPIANNTNADVKPLVQLGRCGCNTPTETNTAESDAIFQDDSYNSNEVVVEDRVNCEHSILIPAGSVDALADALDNICTGGTIWFASGTHTENEGVVINKPVNIKGQNGALLKIQADILLDFSIPVDVALHFKYATKAKLENLTIEPLGDIGGLAVLLEKSNGATVNNCHFNKFEYSIFVQKSGGTKISKNVIVCSPEWLSGLIPEAYGIININGIGPEISSNEVSQGLFGIWGCDKEGIMEKNYTHDNYIGIIACKVPQNGFTTPSGEPMGAKFSCTHWVIKNNKSENNFDAGIIAIDGANKNQFINNNLSNNGTFDIELVGDSYRFGFFTPTCYKNAVWAGDYQSVTIKDCGLDNIVYGGVQIDTEEYPCF